MGIIDDIIASGMPDTAILDLLMERKRRERQRIDDEKVRIAEEKARIERARFEKKNEEITRNAEIAKSLAREPSNEKAIIIKDSSQKSSNEKLDTILHRIGQLVQLEARQRIEMESSQDKLGALPMMVQVLQKFETEIYDLHLKFNQIIEDNSSVQNSIATLQDKQDHLVQGVDKMNTINNRQCRCQTQENNPSNSMQNNVPINVYQGQETDMMSFPNSQTRQNNFNPHYQPSASTGNVVFNSNDNPGYYDNDQGVYPDDYFTDHTLHTGPPKIQTQIFAKGVNDQDQTRGQDHQGQEQGQQGQQGHHKEVNQGSNLMPRANEGSKQPHLKSAKRGKKVKNVYENSNLKSIPGMPPAQTQQFQGPPPTQNPPTIRPVPILKKSLIPNKDDPNNPTLKAQWDMSPSQIEAQKEKYSSGQWQKENYTQRDGEMDTNKEPGYQKPKTNEENRCAKEILFFGEKEPLYINKKQYDQDLFGVIVKILDEASTTYLGDRGFNVKEGDVVRVKVIHSWTGSEENKPMVASFKDEETCNKAKRAIKLGNFYKRRTHSRFGKYKITGDRKIDEENRKLLDKMRYKFARPSTPKAVRAKRQREREERNSNEDYRREKKEEREIREYESSRTADTSNFTIKKFDVTDNVNKIAALRNLAAAIDKKVNNKKTPKNPDDSNTVPTPIDPIPDPRDNVNLNEGAQLDNKVGTEEKTSPEPAVTTETNSVPAAEDDALGLINAAEKSPAKAVDDLHNEHTEAKRPQPNGSDVQKPNIPQITQPQGRQLRPRQQQQQQQQQQRPHAPHQAPAWNLGPNGDIDGDYSQSQKQMGPFGGSGEIDHNGNRSEGDVFTVIKSWSDRVEEEERMMDFDYMNHTQTAPPSFDARDQGDLLDGDSLDGRTAPPGLPLPSQEETDIEFGRTAPPDWVPNQEETELMNGRTAPLAQELPNREETEIKPPDTTVDADTSDKTEKEVGEALERADDETDETTEETVIDQNDIPPQVGKEPINCEGNGDDTANENGRTAPPADGDTRNEGTQREETEIKDEVIINEESAQANLGSQPSQTNKEHDLTPETQPLEQVQTPSTEPDIFLSEEEEDLMEDDEEVKSIERLDNPDKPASRHMQSNIEISKMVTEKFKDFDGLGAVLVTPEKIANARKPMGMLDVNHQRPSTRRSNLRSKSHTRMKELTDKENIRSKSHTRMKEFTEREDV